MILTWSVGDDETRYCDKIDEAAVVNKTVHDKERGSVSYETEVCVVRAGVKQTIPLSGKAFLMSDTGKTIARLF